MKLEGQKVVIVGGTSGIGLAAAGQLAQLGAEVTVAGRDPEKVRRVSESFGIRAEVMDASSEENLRQFFERTQNVDHLVIAVSGGRGGGAFRELPVNEIRAGFDQKFWPQYLTARIGVEYLRKDGSLTFISAASARSSRPGTVGLAAINGAIEAMVRPLARELKPLRVNAVSPGVVETPWWDRFPENVRGEMLRQSAQASLVGRNGKPEDLGDVIVFLIRNSFITGTVIEADGGIRMSY